MMKFLSSLLNKQILAIIGFVIIGVLLMDLNYRVSEYFAITAQRDKVQTQVYQLWLTREVLKTEVAYANSDAAVERWAREEGKMVRPGEVRVVPIPQQGATPAPTPEPKTAPRAVEPWEYWWAIFFEN